MSDYTHYPVTYNELFMTKGKLYHPTIAAIDAIPIDTERIKNSISDTHKNIQLSKVIDQESIFNRHNNNNKKPEKINTLKITRGRGRPRKITNNNTTITISKTRNKKIRNTPEIENTFNLITPNNINNDNMHPLIILNNDSDGDDDNIEQSFEILLDKINVEEDIPQESTSINPLLFLSSSSSSSSSSSHYDENVNETILSNEVINIDKGINYLQSIVNKELNELNEKELKEKEEKEREERELKELDEKELELIILKLRLEEKEKEIQELDKLRQLHEQEKQQVDDVSKRKIIKLILKQPPLQQLQLQQQLQLEQLQLQQLQLQQIQLQQLQETPQEPLPLEELKENDNDKPIETIILKRKRGRPPKSRINNNNDTLKSSSNNKNRLELIKQRKHIPQTTRITRATILGKVDHCNQENSIVSHHPIIDTEIQQETTMTEDLNNQNIADINNEQIQEEGKEEDYINNDDILFLTKNDNIINEKEAFHHMMSLMQTKQRKYMIYSNDINKNFNTKRPNPLDKNRKDLQEWDIVYAYMEDEISNGECFDLLFTPVKTTTSPHPFKKQRKENDTFYTYHGSMNSHENRKEENVFTYFNRNLKEAPSMK